MFHNKYLNNAYENGEQHHQWAALALYFMDEHLKDDGEIARMREYINTLPSYENAKPIIQQALDYLLKRHPELPAREYFFNIQGLLMKALKNHPVAGNHRPEIVPAKQESKK